MIFLPPRKEIHYFSLHYKRGLEWYSDFFSSAKDNQLRGEITPYYLFHPYVAERIAQDLGAVRIIILLRDPLARTLSHYSHACRLGFEDLSLEEALNAERSRLAGADSVLKTIGGRHQQHQECSYLSRSLYRAQVERYWKWFGRSNVLVLPSEFMFDSPWGCVEKIFAFLGLPSCDVPDERALNIHNNKGIDSTHHKDSGLAGRIKRDLYDSYEFARNELEWDIFAPGLWSD